MQSLHNKYFLFLFAFFLTACQKDSIYPQANSGELGETYRPTLSSYRGDQSVQLKWGWYIYNLPTYPVRVNPERFEVWMSEGNPSSFVQVTTLDKEVSSYTLSGLNNETIYYFRVVAAAEDAQPSYSNLIMVIPGKGEKVSSLFANDLQNRTWGSWINDHRIIYMADIAGTTSPSSTSRGIFELDLFSRIETRITDGAKPDPSPGGNSFVFETDLQANLHDKSSKTYIGIFDRQNQSQQIVFGGGAYNHEPSWSPDGSAIVITSNLDSPEEFNLYKIPIGGAWAANRLTEKFAFLDALTSEEARGPSHPNWSADGSKIIYNRFEVKGAAFAQDILEISASGGSEKVLISSEWNDSYPAYSADGKFLAFISDRSGREAIWVFNTETQQLIQLTGSPNTHVSTVNSKLEWSPSGDQILFSAPLTDEVNTLKIVAFP